jgi:hypothetical protein
LKKGIQRAEPLEEYWIRVNFKYKHPKFYHRLYHEDMGLKRKTFMVPEGTAKQVNTVVYNPDAPWNPYKSAGLNTCVFGSIAFACHASGDLFAEESVSSRILESLECVPEYVSIVEFARMTMISHKRTRRKGERRLGYGTTILTAYDPLTMLSNNITLVCWQDILKNVSHYSTIGGRWIFDINYERALPLTLASMHMVCAPETAPVGMPAYECVAWAIRFVPLPHNKAKLNNLM